MSLKTAWLNLQDSLGNRFAWSHVNAVYYNWAQKKLLKEKLDDIDTAINAKVAKTDIVQVESTATDKVPSCAYIKNIKDELDGDIAELNSKVQPIGSLQLTGYKAVEALSADTWKRIDTLKLTLSRGMYIINLYAYSNPSDQAIYGSIKLDSATLGTIILLEAENTFCIFPSGSNTHINHSFILDQWYEDSLDCYLWLQANKSVQLRGGEIVALRIK